MKIDAHMISYLHFADGCDKLSNPAGSSSAKLRRKKNGIYLEIMSGIRKKAGAVANGGKFNIFRSASGNAAFLVIKFKQTIRSEREKG